MTPQDGWVPALRRLRGSRNAWCVTAIVAAVVVANALYLLGFFDPNPIIQFSGLATHVRRGVLPGINVIDPNAGFTSQALGHRAVLDWFGGHLPWWDPYEGLGSPLAGEMQAGAFFPPTLLLYFSTGQLYVHVALECTAGIATYFLLLRFVRFRTVAMLGGIAFALNGTFAWFEHAPVNPVAFLPLLLLGIELVIERVQQGSQRGWVTITVAVALLAYAGFPEVAFIDCLLAVLWLAGRLLTLERSLRVRVVLRAATGVGVGVLVAAPILVAFVDYLPNADIGAHASAYAYASFPRAGLPQVVYPYVYGPLFGFDGSDKTGVLAQLWGGGYASALLVVLAALGLVGKTYRPLRLVLLAWIVLSVGKTFGVSPITHLLNLIPGVKTTAFDVYAASSWELALVVLAAFGAEGIALRKRGEGRWHGAAMGAVVIMLVALGLRAKPLLQSLRGVRAEHVWAGVSLGWAAASVVGIGLALLLRTTRWRIAVIAGLMVIDSLGLFIVPELSAPALGDRGHGTHEFPP